MEYLPGPKMVFIPGGVFSLDPHLSKLKRRVVEVQDFWMDETPVTVAQYLDAVKAGACSPPDGTDESVWSNWGVLGREDHPVNCVDWYQACAYAKWAGKRLPSEEEWEWAARGGDEARLYPWGNEKPRNELLCWNRYGEGKPNSTCPVGSYPKGNSKHGLQDMAGNVWEWTASLYTSTSEDRINRGGSWFGSVPVLVQASIRYSNSPTYRNSNLGVRCARSA